MANPTSEIKNSVDVSIVVPLYNEQENVRALYGELSTLIDAVDAVYEVIFISDGSTDQTVKNLRMVAGQDERVTIIELARNFGQTSAMAAGFNHAKGRVIVPIDGDLQNDPTDIPSVVAKLDEDGRDPGKWDVVSGWRKNRQDKMLSRRLPSRVANWIIRRMTWTTEIHDFGCSLKAYRREVLQDVRIYGEMHRFLPAICKWRGARVTEISVNHRPRMHGESKYGLKRTIKVMLDLLTVKFLGDYLTKPMYFFGKMAMVSGLMGCLSLVFSIMQKMGWAWTEHGGPVSLNRNIFVLFSMMLFLVAVLFLMMGVLSELMVRIYHESRGLAPYRIRQIIAGGPDRSRSNPETDPGSDVAA